MTKLNFQIEIPRRSPLCFKGQEPLTPGIGYYSVLIENEKGEYLRQDYCAACWEKVRKTKDIVDAHTHWKSKVPTKKEPMFTTQSRDERVFILLKQALSGDTDDDSIQAFVLAIYLERRRHLFLRREYVQDGYPINLYEVAETEEMLCVKKVPLSMLDIDKVQSVIAKKLSGKE